mmetsp:Transcript_40709/g.98732  ORF Transcript_40709/g.98732 Transcript_40709/m.98732 type:complete len:231 (-) Transcript_40709:170-862(-)
MGSSKAEFNKYLEASGANQLLARAVVVLATASDKEPSTQPAVCLRDFFEKGGEGKASAELSAAQKEKFGAYLKSSGAADLTTKALVELFNADPRPTNTLSFFTDFFKKEAAGAPSPPPPQETERQDSMKAPEGEAKKVEVPPPAPHPDVQGEPAARSQPPAAKEQDSAERPAAPPPGDSGADLSPSSPQQKETDPSAVEEGEGEPAHQETPSDSKEEGASHTEELSKPDD